MLFEQKIIVSGVVMKLRPYTEKRAKELLAVNAEIKAFLDENPEVTTDSIVDKRAEWYKRKADILWEPEITLSIEFFKSDDFEVSLLKETEDFFLQNRFYL